MSLSLHSTIKEDDAFLPSHVNTFIYWNVCHLHDTIQNTQKSAKLFVTV